MIMLLILLLAFLLLLVLPSVFCLAAGGFWGVIGFLALCGWALLACFVVAEFLQVYDDENP